MVRAGTQIQQVGPGKEQMNEDMYGPVCPV